MNWNTVLVTMRKELKTYFLSPVALIFLGVFLLVTLFSFFTYSRFFARNIADVRPLFEWLPLLLIFLVSAITMRAWSEEEKIGTLEILMTLPVKTADLVMGKFLAGLALVGLALLLTLPLPITVSMLGDVDWGPVFGGYLGALLLAAMYLAIGLCVSSRTDNQIVSLMVTAVVCGIFYLIGSDSVVAFFGDRMSELLRGLGSGSRFASVERGVLDLRDLAYYGTVTAFFLVLNIHFLDSKRAEASTSVGRSRLSRRWVTVALVALNVAAANLWLSPITGARADLTQGGEYSVSESTRNILSRLDEPLFISGYFSDRTHPLLAPLVPQIRDLVREYQIRGRGNVSVEFVNPNEDEELEAEIGQAYDIRPVPFRVTGRHEDSVVNSYFQLLLRYGDQYQVLGFDDLVEIYADENEAEVRLRNLEYDLTRAIKKLSGGFQSVDAVFAGLSDSAKLTAYVTPDSMPEEFAEVPERLRKIAGELEERSDGRFSFEEVNPIGNEALQKELEQKYQFRPLAVSLFGGEYYYLYLLLQVGNRLEGIHLQGDLSEAAIQSAIEASLKRSTPGFLKTVMLMTEKPVAPPPNPNLPPQFQPPTPPPDYRLLESTMAEDLTVHRSELEDGLVPIDVDVLIVAKPGAMNDKQRFAIDQFLMRGGSVVVLSGGYEISAERGNLQVRKTDAEFLKMLGFWGVDVEDSFVLDEQNARFPVPIQERRGMFTVQSIHLMDYPFFPDVRREGFMDGHVALGGLQNVVLNWGSALNVEEREGVEVEELLRTAPGSWLHSSTRILPDRVDTAETAFPPTGDREARLVAATLVGSFPSYFGDKPSPIFGADDADTVGGGSGDPDRTGRTIKQSTTDARLVVVGSSAMASDLIKGLGDQVGGGVYRDNFALVRNLVDWALEDTDLLSIRSSGSFARTLRPMSEGRKTRWEFYNYALVFAALLAVVIFASTRRRRAEPISLGDTEPIATKGGAS